MRFKFRGLRRCRKMAITQIRVVSQCEGSRKGDNVQLDNRFIYKDDRDIYYTAERKSFEEQANFAIKLEVKYAPTTEIFMSHRESMFTMTYFIECAT